MTVFVPITLWPLYTTTKYAPVASLDKSTVEIVPLTFTCKTSTPLTSESRTCVAPSGYTIASFPSTIGFGKIRRAEGPL